MRIPSTLVLLGEPIEIITEADSLDAPWVFDRNKFYLAAAMSGKELWVIPRPSRKIQADSIPDRAARLFEKFVGWSPERAYRFEEPNFVPKPFGIIEAIAYRSNKWTGKQTGYIHRFENRTRIQVDNTRRPSIWRIYGPRLDVRAEGITG